MKKSDHVKFLSKKNIDWDEVTEMLLDLEIERHYLKEHLTEPQIKEYDDIIELYETQRFAELNKNLNKNGFARVMNAEFQGGVSDPDEVDDYEG